jgi:hypothetical protein
MADDWQEISVSKIMIDQENAWRAFANGDAHVVFSLSVVQYMDHWQNNGTDRFEQFAECRAIHDCQTSGKNAEFQPKI